jgi:hypothetical protein
VDTDRKIQEAIASGEKNKQAMELIHNWCRHARVQKVGGTGLVEMETGLPIGHHSMACDHAPAGGFATWDLTQAALDFHDRNCVTCTHRAPVRLPNLTTLLQQRDAYRKRAEEEKRVHDDRTAAQRAARQRARQSLRTQLNTLSATIVDHLEEIDQDTSSDAKERLLGAAQLAPETFTPAVVEHFFSLLEDRESWIDETGLRVLNQLRADQTRLTRCALLSLGEHRSIAIAATIVEANSKLIDESLVADALPALVGLANPERTLSMNLERELVSGPLIAMYVAHSAATEAGIGKLLEERNPYLVSSGARAILVLAQKHKNIAHLFARSLVAKLARAKWLLDRRETGYAGDDEAIYRLQDAIVLALEYSPDETDAMMMQFIVGASSEAEVRIYKVYENVLRARHRRDDRKALPNAAARVALKRLIGTATTSTNEEVLREVLSAFSHVKEELSSLARDELTGLLGAAILLDSRVQHIDAEPVSDENFLNRLERRNYRDLLLSLQNNLIKWAASAASGDAPSTEQYIEILARIPEGQDQLRSALIRNTHKFMEMPDGLNAVLPALYTAMVGSSTLVRAAAAKAIGKLNRRGREDVPELLYEALTALLSDPYVIVHHAAVGALEHLKLPEKLDRLAKISLIELIYSYAASHSDDRFLLQCIQLHLHRYTTDVQKRGKIGAYFVELLGEMKPDVLAEKLTWLRHDLNEAEGFAALVLRTLTAPDATAYQQDDMLLALNDLPAGAILAHKSQLEAIATAPNVKRSLPANLVETLTRAGAWEEAARINTAIYARIPDTIEKNFQKLTANLARIAARYEEAIALGSMDALPELALEWRTTETQIENWRIKNAQRNGPFAGFPGTN